MARKGVRGMTNEKLKEIEDRLLEKGNRHRDVAV